MNARTVKELSNFLLYIRRSSNVICSKHEKGGRAGGVRAPTEMKPAGVTLTSTAHCLVLTRAGPRHTAVLELVTAQPLRAPLPLHATSLAPSAC